VEVANGQNVSVVLEDSKFLVIVFELKSNYPECIFLDDIIIYAKTVGYTATPGVDFECNFSISNQMIFNTSVCF